MHRLCRQHLLSRWPSVEDWILKNEKWSAKRFKYLLPSSFRMHQLRWQHPLGQWPSVPSFILSIFKFYLGLTNCSLITSFDLIMNVELGFLQARSVVVYLWKGFCRKAWVRRWWNGKLVFKFQHLAYTTISKKWKPLKMFSRFFFIIIQARNAN